MTTVPVALYAVFFACFAVNDLSPGDDRRARGKRGPFQFGQHEGSDVRAGDAGGRGKAGGQTRGSSAATATERRRPDRLPVQSGVAEYFLDSREVGVGHADVARGNQQADDEICGRPGLGDTGRADHADAPRARCCHCGDDVRSGGGDEVVRRLALSPEIP